MLNREPPQLTPPKPKPAPKPDIMPGWMQTLFLVVAVAYLAEMIIIGILLLVTRGWPL